MRSRRIDCEVSHVTLEDGLPGRGHLRLDGVRRLVCGRDLAAGCRPAEFAGRARTNSADDAPRFLGSRTLGSALASEKNQTIAAFCLVGAAIGAGLGLAGGLSNWQLRPQVFRMLRGLIAGGLGGISGGWVGAMIYQTFRASGDGSGAVTTGGFGRSAGWRPVALVGLADGLFTLSPQPDAQRPDRRTCAAA